MRSLSTATQALLAALTVALIVVVVVFALGGDEETGTPTGSAAAPEGDPEAVALFQDNCGTCHTLSSAGTDGNVGPVLDDYSLGREEVLTTIAEGPAEMPPGLLEGADAEAVAELIAGDEPTLADPSDAAEDDGPAT
jgi:mono/diheme cytochrome c family protein